MQCSRQTRPDQPFSATTILRTRPRTSHFSLIDTSNSLHHSQLSEQRAWESTVRTPGDVLWPNMGFAESQMKCKFPMAAAQSMS